LSARLALWQRLRGDAPADADVDILLSERAWKTFERLQRSDPARAEVVWSSLDKLYYQKFWPPDNPHSSLNIRPAGKDTRGSLVLKFRGDHDHVRGFFWLIKGVGPKDLDQVLIDDFSLTHDEEAKVASAVLGHMVSDDELRELAESALKYPVEPEQRRSGPLPGRPGTRYRLRLNVPYEDIESALTWAYSTANIQPTPEQVEAISSPAPILINGQAGTGKTSMLAIRAAWVAKHIRRSRVPARILCTAYSRPVVEVLKSNIRDVLLYKLHETAAPEQDGTCELQTFPFLLLAQLDDAKRSFYSRRENRVSFGRFNREFFQPLKQHGVVKGDSSAEFIWYAIRCFLKGYGEERALTLEDFGSVSDEGTIPKKLTRELSKAEIELAISVFDRYTKWLHEGGLFDDIDLARAAWERIGSKPPHTYDEIYLDEAQDLTRVEFRVLEALLKPTSDIPSRGIRLVLAGDPLQTIHPTGFNWRGVRALFYQGEELRRTDLKINHRTPQPIVDLANAVQRRRSFYGLEDLVEQEAREQAGLKPSCYQVESTEDDDALVELLKNPRPGTAIIVWAEDDQELIQLIREDRHLNRAARELLGEHKVAEILSTGVDSSGLDALMASMLLHSVSEAKGLEFERVVLYKFASNPRFSPFARFTVDNLPTKGEFQARIPILYHLNRLYVALTRSTRYLFIIDKSEAVETVWGRFPEIDLSRVHQLSSLQSDPALSTDEHLNWIQRGRQYLDMFHEEQVARWLVHALTCLERAKDNAEARALIVEVRAEIKEQEATLTARKSASSALKIWKEAGELWEGNPVFYLRAAKCYVNSESWGDVVRVLGASTRLSPLHEGWYLYSRLQTKTRGDEKWSAEAYLDFLARNRDLPRNEEWVTSLSRRLVLLKEVAGLVKLHGEICWSGNRGDLKHPTSLVEALSSLDRPAEVVRFIERYDLQRHLWKAYSEAMRKLAREAEAKGDWGNAGRLWKSVAQQSPNQEANGEEYRLAGNAFANAALGGSSSHWADAASCYAEVGPACARHRATSEAEAAFFVSAYVQGIRTLASTITRDWISDGPLKEKFSDEYCCKLIVQQAAKAPPSSLCADWEGLNASVDAYLFLGKRSECKAWLQNLASRFGARTNLAYRRLASLEEEDKEFGPATLDYERAGAFDKAWSLASSESYGLTSLDLARLEGRYLAWRYERQKEPSREDADRAIILLTEAGQMAGAKEVEALRLSREKDLLEKVRLVLSKGTNLDSFMVSVRLVNAAPLSERTPAARGYLLEVLAQDADLQSRSTEEIRSAVRGWLADADVQRSTREHLSLEQFGVAVEFSMDEAKAKEFFIAEAAQNEWAREAYRRTIRRMIRDSGQRLKDEQKQKEYVEVLEHELAEAEKRWAVPSVPVPGPSGSDVMLMRTTLEAEPIAKLRERCKEVGLPEIPGASKTVLAEVYLAYWVGVQRGAARAG
jgi:superfamily I DNA/RNA helicase